MQFDENLADFGCGLEEESSLSKNAAAFLKSYARTSTVVNLIDGVSCEEEREKIIREYLDFCYEIEDGKITGGKNVVSFNVNGLGFESVAGEALPDLREESLSTLYLVEFFTHCCINCIHSIEDVREVHARIEDSFGESFKDSTQGFKGMKVLSIHSPKFPREKDLTSIRAFCKRMQMDHSDVVNDPECIVWNELGVSCWPTLLILGPNPDGHGPNLLFNFMGEEHKEELLITLNTAMKYFKDKLVLDSTKSTSLRTIKNISVDKTDSSRTESHSFLRFPGKVSTYGELIVVSDSGNNRILVLDKFGFVLNIIGGLQKGNANGKFEEAKFYNPQGIAFETDNIFYVADTGNHSIRKVDLKLRVVSTLVETGQAVQVKEDSVILKSPWDLTFYDPNTLIIAAAGNHRLFGYFFEDTLLFGTRYQKNSFTVIAGSGREENRNNSYIMKASFAQPSGITTVSGMNDERIVYIADSESSSIRSISSKGQVAGLVGGTRDPTDLFAFGDLDGTGINVKLQHPMGVCGGSNPDEIYIADTYNHKIKRINVTSKQCQTFISTGLNEPSGICLDRVNDQIFVADANNHCIKIVGLKSGSIRELEISGPNIQVVNKNQPVEKYHRMFEVTLNESLKWCALKMILVPLPDAFEGGQWKLTSCDGATISVDRGAIDEIKDRNAGLISFKMENIHDQETLQIGIQMDVYFCGPAACLKRTRRIKIVCMKTEIESENNEFVVEWNNMTWDT